MVILYIKRAMLSVAAAGACISLAEQYGTTTAYLIWASMMVVACGIGALLLRTSLVSQLTWRNRLAGYMIPCGWRLNRAMAATEVEPARIATKARASSGTSAYCRPWRERGSARSDKRSSKDAAGMANSQTTSSANTPTT